jgi:two-component system, cell cycle response regulator
MTEKYLISRELNTASLSETEKESVLAAKNHLNFDRNKHSWQRHKDALIRANLIDSETGLLNRRGFFREVRELRKTEDKGAVLFLDVDKFKNFNDTFGHEAGDKILKEVSKYLNTKIGEYLARVGRESDPVCRWGGDEFVVYFSNAASQDIVNRFTKEGIAKIPPLDLIINVGEKPVKVTVTFSAGIVDLGHFEQKGLLRKQLSEAQNMADKALYIAKSSGRDRLINYDDIKEEAEAAI